MQSLKSLAPSVSRHYGSLLRPCVQCRPPFFHTLETKRRPQTPSQRLFRLPSIRGLATADQSKLAEPEPEPEPEQWLPPPVVQRAVAGLLDDALKYGTFSWDFTITACLTILLQALLYERYPSTNASRIARRLKSWEFSQLQLGQLEHGRLYANLYLPESKSRHPIVFRLQEHRGLDNNAMDLVKILHIHARRLHAIDHDLSRGMNPYEWRQPRTKVIPLWSNLYQHFFTNLGSDAGKSRIPTAWKMAVLAAGIEVPNTDFGNMKPFLCSDMPDHRKTLNLAQMRPQSSSDSKDFVDTLAGVPDSSTKKCAESLERWRLRLRKYYHCPFECGTTSATPSDMKTHSLGCLLRPETKALGQAMRDARVFPCEYCDKRFARKDSVQLHIRYSHQRYEPFACPVEGCSSKAQFITLSSFRGHYDFYHAPGCKAVRCPLCPPGTTLGSRNGLREHLLWKHSQLSRDERLETSRKAVNGSKTKTASFMHYIERVRLKPDGPFLAPYLYENNRIGAIIAKHRD